MVDTYGPCLRQRRSRRRRRPRGRRRLRCHTFGFRLITCEKMHQFHSNFTDGSNIIYYRSSLKKGTIRKILIEL